MTSNPSLRILLIEESKDLQEITKIGINLSIDATVDFVRSIADAIAYLNEPLPDLIFLGFEHHSIKTLEMIHQALVRPVPVIVLMNQTRLSDQLKIQRYGAKAILSYTFEPVQLRQLLYELTSSH